MGSMNIKIDVDVGNIGKIYRNDQGVLARKMLAMDVGSIPEFDPDNEYKEKSIEKLKDDLGIKSPSLLCKEFQCNVPCGCDKTSESIARQILKDIAGIDSDDIHELTNKIIWDSNKGPATTKCEIDLGNVGSRYFIMDAADVGDLHIKPLDLPNCNIPLRPSPMYLFANLDDIRMRTEIEHNVENNTCTYRYKRPNGGPVIKVMVDREDVIGKLRKAVDDYAVREIAKRYDDMMCRRYFNMSAVDFKILSDRVMRLGGIVSIEDRNWHPFADYAGPMVNIQLPADKLDRIKIENELVYQHAMTPRVPVVDKIVTHNDRVTIVYFVDGTFTKCVCGKDEEFNLYTGVAFCLFKKILSHMGDDGHKKFNTMMRKAMKTIEDEEKLQKMISQAKHEEKLREAKRLEKKRRKELKKKEDQIYIMQEALRRDREAANLENTPEAFKPDC